MSRTGRFAAPLADLAGALWRRRFRRDPNAAEARRVRVAPDAEVLVRAAWQQDRHASPTVLLVHGLEGCDQSCYMLGTADKALAAGWNAVRMNVRNCGGTEHLAPTLSTPG